MGPLAKYWGPGTPPPGLTSLDVRRRIGLACDAVRILAKIWKNYKLDQIGPIGVHDVITTVQNRGSAEPRHRIGVSHWCYLS